MKKIIMQNEATINAEGKYNSNHCKPVLCITTGKTFTSVMDAAEYAGISQSAMTMHLQGKTRTANGKRYCFLSRVTEHLGEITERLGAKTETEEVNKERIRADLERYKLIYERTAKRLQVVSEKIGVLKAQLN